MSDLAAQAARALGIEDVDGFRALLAEKAAPLQRFGTETRTLEMRSLEVPFTETIEGDWKLVGVDGNRAYFLRATRTEAEAADAAMQDAIAAWMEKTSVEEAAEATTDDSVDAASLLAALAEGQGEPSAE